MAQPADVIREMEMLDVGDEPERAGSNGDVVVVDSLSEEIAKQRDSLTKLSAKADRMNDLVHQIRETARGADVALRDLEVDLALLRSEED